MRKVRMTKVFRNDAIEGGLRTDTVEGILMGEYQVGNYFVMMGNAIEKVEGEGIPARLVRTSMITDIKKDGDDDLIRTASESIYRIERI